MYQDRELKTQNSNKSTVNFTNQLVKTLGNTSTKQLFDLKQKKCQSKNRIVQRMKYDEFKKVCTGFDEEYVSPEFESYISTIPAEVLKDTKWVNSLQMIAQYIKDGKQPPPNPYGLAGNSNLFRGTTIDSKTGKVFEGSAGSANGTPTTTSPAVAAIFALKTAGYEPAFLMQQVESLRKGGTQFLAPDTMAHQEKEVTLNKNPSDTASIMKTIDFSVVLRALQTVNRDYSQYYNETAKKAIRDIGGNELDHLIKNAANLNSEEIAQFENIINEPNLYDLWKHNMELINLYKSLINIKVFNINKIKVKIKNIEMEKKLDVLDAKLKEYKKEEYFLKKQGEIIAQMNGLDKELKEILDWYQAEEEKQKEKEPEEEIDFKLFD